MPNWRQILVAPSTTLKETMGIIDKSALQFAVVIDDDKHLLGTVTDGDIRRGILKGASLDSPITETMNNEPFFAYEGKNQQYYSKKLKQHKIKQLPIVDKEKKLTRIVFLNDNHETIQNENVVILMAGGLGTRLRPLTKDTPKPMLQIGNKPILQIIIEGFKSHGFSNFVLSVNYKKEVIKNYFQDGSFLGVNISYIDESKRLGTAGALSLLEKEPEQPFFVMNGDLLTKINYKQLIDFHNEQKSIATMCVREYEYQIPFGVIETEDNKLVSIKEKPVHHSFVNAGIYVLSPEVLKHVPVDTFYDMPDLFNTLLEQNESVSAFPLREYWLDIGRMDDFEKAIGEYDKKFVEGQKL